MIAVAVRGLQILLGGIGRAAAVIQRVGIEQVDVRDLRIVREVVEDLLVPAGSLDEIRRIAGCCASLGHRLIVTAQIFHALAQLGEHFRRRRATVPVGRRDLVSRDIAFLLAHDQVVEAAFAVRLDHAELEFRRARMHRVAFDESAIGQRSIAEAPLFDEQVAERVVDQRIEARLAARLLEVGIDRTAAAQGRERQARHPQARRCQVELFLGHGGERGVRVFKLALRQLAFQDREEHRQALVVLVLLVQRPAVLVLRRLVEAGSGAKAEHELVVGLGLVIAAQVVQQFGAAEAGIADQARLRILLRKPAQGRDCLIGLADVLVAAGKLVQHAVVVRRARPLRQQLVVGLDRLIDHRRVGVALGILDLQLQIGLPTHRLVAGVIVGRKLQQLAIVLQRLVRIGRDRLRAHDRQLRRVRSRLTADRTDRRRSVLRRRSSTAGQEQRRNGRGQRRAYTKGSAQGRARHGASPLICLS